MVQCCPLKEKFGCWGHNLSRLPRKSLRQIQRQIGTIYQQFHLVDNLRVIHNVNAGHLGRWSFFKGSCFTHITKEVGTAARALNQVGIAEKLYERTDTLSGGQQQRVAIARVLVQNPRACHQLGKLELAIHQIS
jgi:phosphonate transport system ATP-binding protein